MPVVRLNISGSVTKPWHKALDVVHEVGLEREVVLSAMVHVHGGVVP